MGQVQSRQQDESYFKLDAQDKDAVIKKYTGTLSCLALIVLFSFPFLCSFIHLSLDLEDSGVTLWVLVSNDGQGEGGKGAINNKLTS